MNQELSLINELDIFSGPKRDYFPNRPIGSIHTFYLSGDIKSPDNYIHWFEIIRNSGEHDVIRLIINSHGGDLLTAVQFMRVLQETEATVIASIEGACMSAATMIFLQASVFEISEHSMFMIHNYSGGTIGKGGEMYDNIVYERKWSDNLLHKVYKDFLSEEEIDSVLNNKDLWLDGDEVLERIKRMGAIVKQDEETVEEVVEKPQPKPKKKPATRRKKSLDK